MSTLTTCKCCLGRHSVCVMMEHHHAAFSWWRPISIGGWETFFFIEPLAAQH